MQNVKSFYSGHYKTHGINVQAACNHHCRFVFLGVAEPRRCHGQSWCQQAGCTTQYDQSSTLVAIASPVTVHIPCRKNLFPSTEVLKQPFLAMINFISMHLNLDKNWNGLWVNDLEMLGHSQSTLVDKNEACEALDDLHCTIAQFLHRPTFGGSRPLWWPSPCRTTVVIHTTQCYFRCTSTTCSRACIWNWVWWCWADLR